MKWLKMFEKKMECLHKNINSIKLEYNSLKEKYEKEMEATVIELCNMNHGFTFMCNENEDPINENPMTKELVIDAHIPPYRSNRIIKSDDYSRNDDSELADSWTEVVKSKEGCSFE